MKIEEKIKILLVDDQPQNLLALEAILQSPDYQMVKARSGKEALKHLLNEDFAVILLDVQMPDLDGFETAHLIKQRDRSKHIPILFLTAISKNEEQIFKGYSIGAVDYVLKPLNPMILKSKVSVFVDLYKKNRQFRQEQKARADAEAARNDLSFLVEAGALLSSSLDYRKTLEKIAYLAVPKIADWCIVDLLEKGELRRLAVAHVDPSKKTVVCKLERRHRDRNAAYDTPRVLRSGQPRVYSKVPDSILKLAVRDEKYLEMIRPFGPRSAMIVPLRVRDQILGVITFISAECGLIYGERDLSMVQELAHRAAFAIDHARLYFKAQEISRTQAQFLSNVSHELRAPLNTIFGFSHLLIDEAYGPVSQEQKSPLEAVIRSAHSGLDLVNNFLDLSKIDSGNFAIHLKEIDMVSLIDDVLVGMRPLFDEKALAIQYNKPETFPAIESDPDKITQILVHLLSRVVKFTQEGGIIITLKNKLTKERVEVSIENTGAGIKPEELSRIFSVFQPAEASPDQEFRKVDLGLRVAKELINVLGGEIKVKSISQSGSTLTVFFPYKPKRDLLIHNLKTT